MRILYILWLRQIKKYMRSKARIIGSLGQPLLFFVALGFGLGPVYAKAGGGDYIQFLAPGIVAMSILFTAMFAGIEIIWDKQFGFLKETMVAPVARWKIMLGRTIGGATVAAIQGIVVLTLALLIGFRPDNWALIPVAIVLMAIIGLIFTALGTAIASKLDDMQSFPLIMNFLMMPLFFLSGALFPLDGLPKILTWITRFNPVTYCVDALRHTLLESAAHFSFALDIGVMVGVAILFLGIGTWFFNRIEV